MVRSSIDSRESLVWIGLSWAWASLVILPSGRIELVASAFPLSESLRGVTETISQLVGQMHWHWRIRFLLFQKRVQIPLPCCWVCPSFFLLEEWLASFFIHHWNWKLRNHPWWLFQFLIQLNCPAASSAFRSHMHRLILNRHIQVLPTQQVPFLSKWYCQKSNQRLERGALLSPGTSSS